MAAEKARSFNKTLSLLCRENGVKAEAVEAFYVKHLPQRFKELQQSFKPDVDMEEFMMNLEPAVELYVEYLMLKEQDEELALLMVKIEVKEFAAEGSGGRIRELKEQLRKNKSAALKKEISVLEKKLNQQLSDIFDLKLKVRAREIKVMEDQIAELKRVNALRLKMRRDLLKIRFLQLSGEGDALEW